MSITKQYLKSKPKECKVTFTVAAEGAKEVKLAGDFTDWKPKKSIALKKLKNSSFKGSVSLPKDKSYEFKYYIDGEWVNDPEADSYKWNDFAAADNSVVEV